MGWFPDASAERPARHRSGRPIWADAFVTDVAPHVRAGCVVAAVRSATPPAPIEETGAAPFTDGQLLFSHNGAVADFTTRVGPVLRSTLAPEIQGSIQGATDSELLFACVRQARTLGASLTDAVAQTVHAVLAMAPARLNLLVAERGRLVATAMGDTLFTRVDGSGAWVASEPVDDSAGWTPVADGSLVVVTEGALTVDPL
jgi:glutamine amidotransferase